MDIELCTLAQILDELQTRKLNFIFIVARPTDGGILDVLSNGLDLPSVVEALRQSPDIDKQMPRGTSFEDIIEEMGN